MADKSNAGESRLEGAYPAYSAYAYEAVLEMLGDKFGRACTIWIIRPSEFAHGVFSRFSNFVHANDYGAAIDCGCLFIFVTTKRTESLTPCSILPICPDDPSGSATEHLVNLMKNVRDQLFDEDGECPAFLAASGAVVDRVLTVADSLRPAVVVTLSLELPIHLVGFSKGGCVLNQLVTELAGSSSPASNPHSNNDAEGELSVNLFAKVGLVALDILSRLL